MSEISILLVEDEAITALSIKKMLENLEYRVVDIVHSGEEAVAIAEEKKPDLALMDIGLAGEMDGIDSASIIQSKFDIPVIYITATTDKETLQRAKLSEPYGYIIKPVSINELYSNIETVLYRHRLELKLKYSENQYRTLVETISQGIVEYNLEGTITFCNESFCQMTEQEKEKILGKKFSAFTTQSNVKFQFEEQKNNKNNNTIRYTRYFDSIIRHGREPLEVQIDWDFKFNENNQPTGIIVVITDITENIKLEKLRKIEHSIALSLSTSSNIVDVYTSIISIMLTLSEFSDILLYENNNEKSLLELRKSTLPDERISSISVLTKTSGSYKKFMCSDIKTIPKKDLPAIFKNLYPENTMQSLTIIPLGDDEDIASVMVCISLNEKDISPLLKKTLETIAAHIGSVFKRISIESALKESESQYRKLVETMTDGIFILDSDNNITYANSRFSQMLGHAAQNLIGKSITLFTDKKNSLTITTVLDSSETSQPGAFEMEWIKNNGDIVYTLVSPQVIYDKTSHFKESFAVVTDITDHKKLEHELIKIQRLESLSLLAGGIAHDYNNILTGILGNINLAKLHSNEKSEVYDILQEAEEAAIKARDISQQLLTFSRGGEPIKKPLNISELIHSSATFGLRGSNVSCKFMLPHDLWAVEADEGQMSQVIDNIIINAKQAMEEGGHIIITGENINIPVTTSFPLSAGRYVKISINDQGTGIPLEYSDRIFDLFFTTKQHGNGIGLASSFSIIKKHRGHLYFDSEPGVGTTFHIFIPASDKVLKSETAPEYKILPHHGRVLVMDDEEIIRKLARRMLSKLGYTVLIAEDGAEAVNIYKDANESNKHIDVVLMDLTVPGGMGGIEAAERILNIDADAVIIATSGYTNDPIRSNFHEFGFKNFLPKPYKLDELIKTLDTVY